MARRDHEISEFVKIYSKVLELLVLVLERQTTIQESGKKQVELLYKLRGDMRVQWYVTGMGLIGLIGSVLVYVFKA